MFPTLGEFDIINICLLWYLVDLSGAGPLWGKVSSFDAADSVCDIKAADTSCQCIFRCAPRRSRRSYLKLLAANKWLVCIYTSSAANMLLRGKNHAESRYIM